MRCWSHKAKKSVESKWIAAILTESLSLRMLGQAEEPKDGSRSGDRARYLKACSVKIVFWKMDLGGNILKEEQSSLFPEHTG